MKICVFTGTRAEYGLLRSLLTAIAQDDETTLQLIASGTHLSEKHGNTIEEIRADGFIPDVTIPLDLDACTSVDAASAIGEVIHGCAQALATLKPDVLVILGDRYEAFACASAATVMRTPIAHIHGGETTEGAMDEAFRHAITKMAHLHFTAAEVYRRRVIQMGESPDLVYNSGSLGVENTMSIQIMKKAELEADISFTMKEHCLLCTFHPPTLSKSDSQKQAFFEAMEQILNSHRQVHIIMTGANADPGGRAIDSLSAQMASRYPKRVLVTPSLGLKRYLSAMQYCAAVVGNSSSGIIEAPTMKTPTVNIGDRQKGRICADSVLHCAPTPEAIRLTVEKALSPQCQALAQSVINPYHRPGTSSQILQRIKGTDYSHILKKHFHDFQLDELS